MENYRSFFEEPADKSKPITIFGRNTHPFVCSDLGYHAGVLMKIAISECQPWIMSNHGVLIRGMYPSVVMMNDA